MMVAYRSKEVVNIDALTYGGNLESLAGVDSDSAYHFDKVDICDRQATNYLFRLPTIYSSNVNRMS